jgi:hypothetical protein
MTREGAAITVLALMRKSGVVLAAALFLSACAAPASTAPTDLSVFDASTIPRDVSRSGASTNTCVDELRDNNSSIGIDLDSVSIEVHHRNLRRRFNN